jgi:hypothetical protein
MDTKHTPEPWPTPVRFDIIGPADDDCSNYWEIGDFGMLEREEDADRIVACVNGCAGINPEAVPEFVHLARLVASLNENHLEIGAGRMLEMVTVARNALAKAGVE